MYNNIGGKIKGLASIVGVGGAVLSGLAFIICLIIAGANDAWEEMAGTIITFVILIPGCVIASYPLYGFGELIEKVSRIASNKQFDPEQQGKSYYAHGKSAFAPTAAPVAPVVTHDLPEL